MSKYVGFRLGKVHESHVISEYYCGGCGWPVTDHDSFCPECGGAFRECDASDFEADNAKLRELVRTMAYCMQDPKDCDKCSMNGARMRLEIDPLFACDGLYDKLRELGIEVNE